MINKLKEVHKISKKINSLINNQSGKLMTGIFNKATSKIDNKWEVKSKINKFASSYFKKRLKEHTLLTYIRKQEQYVDKLFKNRNFEDEGRDIYIKNCLKVSKKIRSKAVIISSVQGGGAAIAGVPFTLLETFSMINVIWEKVELIALVFKTKPYTYFEKVYIFYIICISLSDDREDKIRIYKDLIKLENMIEDKTINLVDQYGHINIETLVKEMAEIIGNPLVSSKLTQTIPMVGVGFGTVISGNVVQKTLILAQLLYLRRYLQKT